MSMTLVLAFSLAKFVSVVLGIFPAMLDILSLSWLFSTGAFVNRISNMHALHVCPCILAQEWAPASA